MWLSLQTGVVLNIISCFLLSGYTAVAFEGIYGQQPFVLPAWAVASSWPWLWAMISQFHLDLCLALSINLNENEVSQVWKKSNGRNFYWSAAVYKLENDTSYTTFVKIMWVLPGNVCFLISSDYVCYYFVTFHAQQRNCQTIWYVKHLLQVNKKMILMRNI